MNTPVEFTTGELISVSLIHTWLRPGTVQEQGIEFIKEEIAMNQEFTKTQKLTISAVCIALYLVVMLCTQSFAFGQYQVRIATALYGLSYLFPFLVVPFGIDNVESNILMGGLGPVDAVCGFIMGLLTSGVIALGRRYGLGCWIVAVAVTLLPGLGVPVWLSYLLKIPYSILAASLLVGQFISGITGMLLVRALEKADVVNLVFRADGNRN